MTSSRNPICDLHRNHDWFEVPDDRRYSQLTIWKHQIVWQCSRCPRRKYEGINARGEVGMRRYWAPPDWYYPVHEKPTQDEFRRMYVRGKIERRRM